MKRFFYTNSTILLFMSGFMNITDLIILILIFGFIGFTIYENMIIQKRNGIIEKKVLLRRKNKSESLVFIALIAILIYQSSHDGISIKSIILLVILSLFGLYTAFLRQPKLLLKKSGMYYTSQYIQYKQIKAIRLPEQGGMLIGLHNAKTLVIYPDNPQEVNNIIEFLLQKDVIKRHTPDEK